MSADSGPWEVAELCLKFGMNVHRGLIVRGHTVSLDGSEKMRADAVRMAVSILQGWLIVLWEADTMRELCARIRRRLDTSRRSRSHCRQRSRG